MIKDNELKALVTLLEDPDNELFKEVEKELLQRGTDVVPQLEKAWENSFNELVHKRIEDIIENIQTHSAISMLQKWKKQDVPDLLFGSYIVARLHYPELNFDEIKKKVEPIRRDIWLELNENLTSLEKVRILNHVFFDIHRFSGNTRNIFAPRNSYINQVLDSKKGNSVSLAILYSSIAQMLDLPIHGVNLPQNFILAYLDKDLINPVIGKKNDPVLFYINPFNKGAVLGKKEIDFFLKKQHIKPKIDYYNPCDNHITISRLVADLMVSYEKTGKTDKIKDLMDLLDILA